MRQRCRNAGPDEHRTGSHLIKMGCRGSLVPAYHRDERNETKERYQKREFMLQALPAKTFWVYNNKMVTIEPSQT